MSSMTLVITDPAVITVGLSEADAATLYQACAAVKMLTPWECGRPVGNDTAGMAAIPYNRGGLDSQPSNQCRGRCYNRC